MADANKSDLVAQDPAVDRGERLATGKTIGRGGKSTGNLPGATEKGSLTKPDQETSPSTSAEPGMPSHTRPGVPGSGQRDPGH